MGGKPKNNDMGLNVSKGNMYSWVTHTWNTIKGECPHGCTYCYVKRWGKQKPVGFDESELSTDLGSGNIIFVGSSCDMFANNIPAEWIIKTYFHCRKYIDNAYLFQSKNPERINAVLPAFYPINLRVCTTIETNRIYPQMGNTPSPLRRAIGLESIKGERYVTIEPIMDFDLDEMINLIMICQPSQVNIGADSGNNHLPEPSREKLLELIDALKEFTVIDKKTNLSRLLN